MFDDRMDVQWEDMIPKYSESLNIYRKNSVGR